MEQQNSSDNTVAPVDYREVYPSINNEHLEDILKSVHPEAKCIDINNFTLKAALPVGENFGSQMVRAVVEYTVDGHAAVHTKKLIFKMFLTKFEAWTVSFGLVFDKEASIYLEVLPKVEAMLRGIGDDTKFGATCYKYNKNPHQLVFEDLLVRGFANVDKNLGCDIKHILPLFTKLAKYHAGTARLIIDKQLDTIPFADPPMMAVFEEMFLPAISLIADAIADWGGYDHVAEKFRRLQPICMEKLAQSYARNENGFNVVTHGDLWSNNFMFKHRENGEVEDVLMVDFQIGYYGSPVHDLSYCIFASFDALTEEDIDTAIQHYHKVLLQTLKALDYPCENVPTLRELRADMFQRIVMETVHFLNINAYRGNMETFDVEKMMDGSGENKNFLRQKFMRKEYRIFSEPLVKYMDRKGLLD